MEALVNRILPFSSVDGPGNRAVIFLQECNFNCLYCHNPETINRCLHCGACIEGCKVKALELINGKVAWNQKKCVNCDVCLKNCKHSSSPKTQIMKVEQVFEEIIKTQNFISGITVSGGECTLQVEFLVELFKKVKSIGLTSFVDTNGSTPLWDKQELLKVMDKVMLDVKAFEVKAHERLTGRLNDIVLKNLEELGNKDKIYEVRTVIVPEVLDNFSTVDNVSKIIARINPEIRYKLIKYRELGVREGMISSYTPKDSMMEEFETLAKKNGCRNIVLV